MANGTYPRALTETLAAEMDARAEKAEAESGKQAEDAKLARDIAKLIRSKAA